MRKLTVIDRGVDEVLRVNGEEHRIDKLSAKQLMGLLSRMGAVDVQTISFDEYEKLKTEFLNIKFDDVTDDAYGIWSQICTSCITKHNVDEKHLKDEANGICGVAGCENEAYKYIDFIRDYVQE